MIGRTNAGFGSGRSNNYWISNVYGGANPPTEGVKPYDIFLRTNVALRWGQLTANVQSTPLWTDSDGAFIISLIGGIFGDNSAAYFANNAQHKNFSISGFPGQAYIHEYGGWRRCDGYIFYTGAWLQFSSAWSGELFDNGNQYNAVTGGWTLSKFSLKDGAFDTGLTSETSGDDVMACTVNKIDVGQFRTLHIQCYSNFRNSGGPGNSRFGICSTNGPSYDNFAAYKDISTGSNNISYYSIDISSVTGTYYVKFYASVAYKMGWLKIEKMWLT